MNKFLSDAVNESGELTLEDGANIAVIGGGPAGSFFTYFTLEYARRYDLEITIDLYETKDFNRTGPAGCNNCGGIVSESLVQTLSAEGIVLPSKVIRRGIESYTLHMEQGITVIKTPFKEQRIASVYRGSGPLNAMNLQQDSFDRYLMELCEDKGANLIHDRMTDLKRGAEGILVKTSKSKEKRYDLVVGSVGLNQRSLNIFKKVIPDLNPPKTTKTFICEFHVGKERIEQHFGNSMHVFLLNIKDLKFGALIPKGEYVTMVLLGKKINKDIVASFMNSKQITNCFPDGFELKCEIPCQCYPNINIRSAENAYSDRIVLIGDSSSSKLYKNGIGAAYITAKAAAKAVVFEGISAETFRKYYIPTCKELNRDNTIGKMIFSFTTLIQKSHILKSGIFRMAVLEQKKDSHKRNLSSVLWDTFTGSAPYTDILKRMLNPRTLLLLLGNILVGIIKPITNNNTKNGI